MKYAVSVAVFVAFFAGIAELTGYGGSDVFQKKNTPGIPAKTHPPAPKASTKGDNSPAVITNDGDVNIHYGESEPQKDSVRTTKTRQK